MAVNTYETGIGGLGVVERAHKPSIRLHHVGDLNGFSEVRTPDFWVGKTGPTPGPPTLYEHEQ